MLVNNAGANFPDGLDEWSPDGFSASLDLNVEGAQRLTVRAKDALAASTMAGGASVVNVVSMTVVPVATTIVPGYSSSKAAPAGAHPQPGRALGERRHPGERGGARASSTPR